MTDRHGIIIEREHDNCPTYGHSVHFCRIYAKLFIYAKGYLKQGTLLNIIQKLIGLNSVFTIEFS